MSVTYQRPGGSVHTLNIGFPDPSDPKGEPMFEALAVSWADGDDCFTLDESPAFSELAGWGDQVRLQQLKDNKYLFLEVTTPSGLHRLSTMISDEYGVCANWTELKRRIMACGGNWEQVFFGIVILHFPKERLEEFEALLDVG